MPKVDDWKVDVPEGTKGDWTVERFTVTDNNADVFNITQAWKPGGRHVLPGTYTRLLLRGSFDNPIMSDTHDETRDHRHFVHLAHGDILIAGLGLGVVVQACLRKPSVQRVTVIELEQDVIDLVAPHYQDRFGDRFEVIHGDALTMKIKRGRTWDCAWYDIWPSICGDNLKDMHRLHRRFGRRVHDYQGSWCRGLCERLARH